MRLKETENSSEKSRNKVSTQFGGERERENSNAAVRWRRTPKLPKERGEKLCVATGYTLLWMIMRGERASHFIAGRKARKFQFINLIRHSYNIQRTFRCSTLHFFQSI